MQRKDIIFIFKTPPLLLKIFILAHFGYHFSPFLPLADKNMGVWNTKPPHFLSVFLPFTASETDPLLAQNFVQFGVEFFTQFIDFLNPLSGCKNVACIAHHLNRPTHIVAGENNHQREEQQIAQTRK